MLKATAHIFLAAVALLPLNRQLGLGIV